jgi:hypothetical protein
MQIDAVAERGACESLVRLLREGFKNPNHAAQRCSWISQLSTSFRSTDVRVVSRTCGVRSPAGTAKPSPRWVMGQFE